MEATYGVESMGETAENICEKMGITRLDQDKYAVNSQRKASVALKSGRLSKEILPIQHIPHNKGAFSEDEFIKPNTSIESLANLKPAFRKHGSVTAGNSSGLNDGAAALFLCSEEAVLKYHLSPLARFVCSAVTGVEPSLMGLGPVSAASLALKRAGLQWSDIDVIELNEAFAAQCLGCIRQWGLNDADPRINPNGGAIALGHPLGMSGARIALSACLELQNVRSGGYALVTMCVGVGQGIAVIFQRC
jgi:acetyl-CoA acyltransferase